MGLWRYSLAMMIVLAAILDVVWWVPQHESKRAQGSHDQVQPTIARCR